MEISLNKVQDSDKVAAQAANEIAANAANEAAVSAANEVEAQVIAAPDDAAASRGEAQALPANPVHEFLATGYDFRRNLISGKIEFRESGTGPFRMLTREEQNSILIAAEAAMPGMKRMRERLLTLIYSRVTRDFDPVADWLRSLPAWDGLNHVDALLNRIPGLSAEERYWLHVWLRSMVAHWLQMDLLHGNELVPTLIGEQGCGKSTFCARLLPEHLRQYYLDHVNMGNKFDKEMALTNNLLVNIDELDQVRRSQQADLKHLLSKSRVNGRPIYGKEQQDRLRYASFVATTNNKHPLHDPTGSRRFLCIEIPVGKTIENVMPIDYDQLYAQLLAELDGGQRYWFTEEEVRAIQRHNAPYESTLDIERIVADCFRLPKENEVCKPLTITEMLQTVTREYPFIRPLHGTKIQIGNALIALGFRGERRDHGMVYYAIPA